jgi:hypothetical protein
LKRIFYKGDDYWDELESRVIAAGVEGNAGYETDKFEKLRAERQKYIENRNYLNELDDGKKAMTVRALGKRAASFVHLHIYRE